MGLVKRRLYKPERRAARKKGVIGKLAPMDCPDATQPEVVSAIAIICGECNVRVGRGGEYDTLRDEYTVIAKVLDGGVQDGVPTGKAQDVKIKGAEVAAAILFARALALGRNDIMLLVTQGRFGEARKRLRGARYERPMTWAV